MEAVAPHHLETVRQRLIVLRWWLIGGLALAVLSAPTLLDIELPLAPLIALLALMGVFNLVVQLWANPQEYHVGDLVGQLAVDLVALGVMLYLAGGASNPLVSLLLLPVAVAAFALPTAWAAMVAALAIALYSLLMFHAVPLAITDVERATRLHLGGMWLTFGVSALMLVWFVSRITHALRERDRQLAAAREQALRDAQVVALGQLAAGAAHELGTPLATMRVISDELAADTRLPMELREDLALLQQQIERCKAIIGGLTRQAGLVRPAEVIRADDWLTGLLARWRSQWPQASCALTVRGTGTPPRLLVETALEQALVNLLDNAAKAAPQGMRVTLDWDEDAVRIQVEDRGPGFPLEVLQSAAKQPVAGMTSGTGLGLWLTRAAIERRGGRLLLSNAAGGVAVIELPRSETV